MNRVAIQQFIEVLLTAFTKSNPGGTVPALSFVDTAPPASYSWQCAHFDGVSDLRIYTCLAPAHDETDAVAAKEDVTNRLLAGFEQLASLGAVALNRRIGGVSLSDTAPDQTPVLLQLSGVPGLEGMMVALDSTTSSWLETNLLTPEQQSNPKRPSMMDTLMDVELPVAILLASRQAPFSDVLKWGPGAVVEFDAGLGDPVEVIVNKQVVARGSIVLVDGNYGVRVTNVLANEAAPCTV